MLRPAGRALLTTGCAFFGEGLPSPLPSPTRERERSAPSAVSPGQTNPHPALRAHPPRKGREDGAPSPKMWGGVLVLPPRQWRLQGLYVRRPTRFVLTQPAPALGCGCEARPAGVEFREGLFDLGLLLLKMADLILDLVQAQP